MPDKEFDDEGIPFVKIGYESVTDLVSEPKNVIARHDTTHCMIKASSCHARQWHTARDSRQPERWISAPCRMIFVVLHPSKNGDKLSGIQLQQPSDEIFQT